MIIGVKKAGTTSFYSSLARHPHVLRGKTKELLFFSQKRFDFQYFTDDTFDRNNVTQEYRINVAKTRKELLKEFPSRKMFIDNPSYVSLDGTPQYIHNFPTSPRSILCTCPWIKILLIVRHPTDRLWSHYNFIHQQYDLIMQKQQQQKQQEEEQAEKERQKNKKVKVTKKENKDKADPTSGNNTIAPFISFDRWIQQDLERLLNLRLLRQTNGTTTTTTSTSSSSDELLSESDVLQKWFDYVDNYVEGMYSREMYV
jgi:hypothetical protein